MSVYGYALKKINKKKSANQKFKNLNNSIGKQPIGKYVRSTFTQLIEENKIDDNEVKQLQRHEYSKNTFDIQFPFLAKEGSKFYEKVRYWKNPFYINGEMFYVCSQWYETAANNDRPYYEDWLKRMKNTNS